MSFLASTRIMVLLASTALALYPLPAIAAPNGPQTPRDFYNDGTRKLNKGDLREAEASLQTAVASNDQVVQPTALYNLGYVRFLQGAEARKGTGKAPASRAQGGTADAHGGQAIETADSALAKDELGAIVRAYLQGRGARKELKAAIKAVKDAMDAYGAVLSRWQRASGDFKSACELSPSDRNAKYNAGVVDRQIAALVDRLKMMQMAFPMLNGQQNELNQRMQELKKRLPDGFQKDGMDDDEEDEMNQPKGPKEGQEEVSPKEGREMAITPEEAARLLQSLQLDARRKLPMGADQTAETRKRTGNDW
ncbi:MAG: hypothetical protein M1608_07080 [Candidatus Omnitrophica bacterium]|nr:hypothetical protein [Candidatus Omnitrophota bacterium]